MAKADVAKPDEQCSNKDRKPKPAHVPVPPAGPHAQPHLTNHEATPGAGALPDAAPKHREVDGGVG